MNNILKKNFELDHPENFLSQQSLAVHTRDLVRLLGNVLEPEIVRYGVTITQYYYLRILWGEDGLSQQELARRVGTKPPSALVTLRGMQKAGLVYSEKNRLDKRVQNIYLTAKGVLLKEKLLPIARRLNDEMLADLSGQDKEKLWALLIYLKEKLSEMIGD